jgi:hypothetical protein
VYPVIDALAALPQLRVLCLSGCTTYYRLGALGAERLGGVLPGLQSLRRLELRRNGIGGPVDRGAAALGTAVAALPALRHLDASYNALSPSARALLRGCCGDAVTLMMHEQ